MLFRSDSTIKSMSEKIMYENLVGLNFGELYKTNNFANIGAGVGMLYAYHYEGPGIHKGWEGGNKAGSKNSSSFTLGDAKWSAYKYNPGNPLLETVYTYMNMQNHRFPGRRKP